MPLAAPISPQYIGPHSNSNPLLAKIVDNTTAKAKPLSKNERPSE